MLGLLLLSVLFKPSFVYMIIILTISGVLSSVVMLYYATELFLRNSNENFRNSYIVFQNIIDSSNALSKPFGSIINSLIGCVYSIASLGIVFMVYGLRLNYKKK